MLNLCRICSSSFQTKGAVKAGVSLWVQKRTPVFGRLFFCFQIRIFFEVGLFDPASKQTMNDANVKPWLTWMSP